VFVYVTRTVGLPARFVTCNVHRLDFGEISKRIRLVLWHHLFAKIVLAFTF